MNELINFHLFFSFFFIFVLFKPCAIQTVFYCTLQFLEITVKTPDISTWECNIRNFRYFIDKCPWFNGAAIFCKMCKIPRNKVPCRIEPVCFSELASLSLQCQVGCQVTNYLVRLRKLQRDALSCHVVLASCCWQVGK